MNLHIIETGGTGKTEEHQNKINYWLYKNKPISVSLHHNHQIMMFPSGSYRTVYITNIHYDLGADRKKEEPTYQDEKDKTTTNQVGFDRTQEPKGDSGSL